MAVGLVCAGATIALAGSAPADSDSDSRQEATMRFTTKSPGEATGLEIKIDYVNPDDPDAKPPPVRELVEKVARRARIDTSVPDQCEASDAQLMAEGPQACPDESVVGDGTIRIDTGLAGPGRFVDVDVTFLNKRDELIFVSRERVSGARVVSRAKVEGRLITPTAPMLPGSPPDGGALDEVDTELFEIERDGRAYISTPRRCPRRGHWRNRVTFTYADGVTEKVKTRNRCKRE